MLLIHLPQEIIHHIISFVCDDELQYVEGTCRKLQRLTNDPLIWRKRCLRFLFWEDSFANGLASPDGHYQALSSWKTVFYRRLAIERKTLRLLNSIITNSSMRIENTEMIAAYGYDAKDCLLEQLSIPDEVADHLARRYHASSTLAYIHRKRAIDYWSKQSRSTQMPLEEALLCFDLFVMDDYRTDCNQISASISTITTEFADSDTDFPSLSTRAKATAICQYMRSIGFIGCSQDNFQELANSFMGYSIKGSRTTLPIISSAIFCSIASRLGLDAYPCAYPYHVYALVRDDAASHFYVDPHTSSDIVSQDELETRLEDIGIEVTPDNILKFLHPATPQDLVLRNARNILRNTPYARRRAHDKPEPDINIDAAEYASLFAIALFANNWTTRILEPLCRCLQESFTLDVGLIETHIIPLAELDSRPAKLLRTICIALRNEDRMTKRPQKRSQAENAAVKFRVGTIFQHRRYGFQAVITGWTTNMTHDGIHAEEVGLRKGLKQPFYRVMVEDLSERYVAQENIVEQRPNTTDKLNRVLAGKYFQRFCNVDGRFISNMQDEYPDD